MAIASREPLLNAGRKRGSGSSIQSSTSRSRSRRAHRAATSRGAQSIRAVDEPTIDELRRARTAFFSRKPEDRLKDMKTETAHQSIGKKDVGPKSVSSRDSRVRVQKPSQRHYSDRRRRRRRHRDTDDESSTVYVYSRVSDTKEGLGAAMPRSTRRAPDSVASSGKGERRRTAQKSKVYRPEPRTESLYRRKSLKDGSERRSSLYTTETVVRTVKRRSTSADAAANARTQRPQVIRSTSMREPPSAPRPPSLLQANLDTVRIVRLPKPKPGAPSINANTERIPANNNWVERRTGILGALFGPKIFVPDEKVECLTCLSDDVPESKSALLACGHRMCHDCLRRIFTMSTTDPQHMPPKCCTADHIPLKHVEKLFSDAFKIKWNKKFQEYTTKNRVYCPARGCGEWIKPANIHLDMSGGANGGRKYGKCWRCKTKVCCACNGKWHASRECPNDEETRRFVEVAKSEGWQRCFNCSAMVELKEGCNHMTCRCRAEFCMICGLLWKTCDCPWFNYEAVENARLQQMNGPQARRMPVPGGAANPPGYNEELERRREQERRDEALARRMQLLGMDDDHIMDRPPRRTRVPRPPPTPPPIHPIRTPRQQRRQVNNVYNYVIPPEVDDDDDSSFIDTRPHENDLRNLMNRAGANNVAEADFIRRAREVLTGNQANAEEAATAMMGEIRTAHGVDGIPMRPSPRARPPVHPVPPPELLRHHSVESRQYNNRAQTRPSERVIPRRNFTDYESEAARHRPATGVAGGTRAAAAGVARRHSAMAGLTRRTGSGRVEEWRRHVDVNGDPSLGPEVVTDD